MKIFMSVLPNRYVVMATNFLLAENVSERRVHCEEFFTFLSCSLILLVTNYKTQYVTSDNLVICHMTFCY